VEKGFLSRLTGQSLVPPPVTVTSQVEKVTRLKKNILTISAVLSHPTLFLAGVLLIILLFAGLLYIVILTIIRQFK